MNNIGFAVSLTFPAAALLLMLTALVRHQRRTKEKDIDDVAPFFLPVNLSALAEFTSPAHERYLRDSDARSMQRKRVRVLIELTKRMFHNAGLLQDLGAGQRCHHNPLLMNLGEELIDTGVQVRLCALLILPRLYIGRTMLAMGPFAFPFRCSDVRKPVVSDLVPAYELLKIKAIHFAVLKSAGFLDILAQNL